MLFCTNNEYIEPNYLPKLKSYKYSGGDNSILYRFVINPLCNKILVPLFPRSLAPNVITVTGWFLNLFYASLLIIYTGWKFSAYIPPWVCYTTAVAYTTYIILDYSDGKQARRIGASSPLGLLVDHGTDACTTFFGTIGLGSLIYLDSYLGFLTLFYSASSAFFLNTWEEYYMGELVLPCINGVAEGMLGLDIAFVLSGLYGYNFYVKQFEFFGLIKISPQMIYLLISSVGGTFYSIKSVIGVLAKIPSEKKADALKNTFIYVIFMFAQLSVPLMNNSYLAREYPKFLILVWGFEFAKIMGILQLSHILQRPYKCYTPVFLIPIFVVLIHSVFYYLTRMNLIFSIDTILFCCFFWNFFSWAHYVYFCSEQICEELNIHRFVLGKRHPELESKTKEKEENCLKDINGN